MKTNNWKTETIVLAVALAGLYLGVTRLGRVKASPDAIVDAMFGDASGRQVLDAIERYGDVNGFSAKHQISLLTASIAAGRWGAFEWLLKHGANPNPGRGTHPLLMADGIGGPDPRTVRILIECGSDWNAKTEGGKTVRELRREYRPATRGVDN